MISSRYLSNYKILALPITLALAGGAASAGQAAPESIPSPAGLVIQAPPPSNGYQLYTIQADKVPLQDVIYLLSRRTGVDFRLDPLIDGSVLGEELTIDLREAALEDIVEILAGMTGVDYEIGRDGAAVSSVHFTMPRIATESERSEPLLLKALDTYIKLLLKHPEHEAALDAQFQIAQIHYEQQQYALAAQDYSLLLKRDSQGKYTSESLFKLGWSYSQLGDFDQASKTFYAFLDRTTDSEKGAAALLALARAAVMTGEHAEALRVYRRLLLEHPRSATVPEAQHELADLLFEQGEYAAAQRQYILLNESFPQHQTRAVKYGIAMCRMMLEDWNIAAKRFAELLASDGKDDIAGDCYHNIAVCFDRLGRRLESLEAYAGAAANFPNHTHTPEARARVVELYRTMGLLESAIDYGEETLKLCEDKAARPARGQLALALLEAGEYERARRLFEELAQEEGPGMPAASAMIYAGDAARKLELYDRAEELYRGALSAGIDNTLKQRALLGMGDTYLARGDYQRAAIAYQGSDPDGR